MVGLTRKGIAKINRAVKRAKIAAQEALQHNIETVLIPAIVKRAPSRSAEEIILVRGEEGRIGFRYRTGGADSYIEELRQPLKDSIRQDYVRTYIRGDRIIAETGHADIINEMSKLYWRVASARGGTRVTNPFYDSNSSHPNYVQAVEFGGTWIVTPRGHYPLRPEPNVIRDIVVKTVHPWRMYGGAIRDQVIRRRMIANIKRYIKSEVQFETMV